MGRGGKSASPEVSESDSWYVSTGIQETYDHIVKESDAWEEIAQTRKSKSRFSFLSRSKSPLFVVDQASPPRLYRVKDNELGSISFELTPVEEGGTSVKTMYDTRARVMLQNFKAKMPIKIPASSSTGPKLCPSCGKQMMPEFTTCPYCGTKLK
ncbi:zinc ribbon domain-containing protein [Candidatus Bathyarchaeota archaeon]|nr:zinc ribbon domain-containing protein [Candidatus Bathyarchaeota archaeon]